MKKLAAILSALFLLVLNNQCAASTKQDIEGLYPDLSEQLLSKKVELLPDSFSFFRGFTLLFYHRLDQLQDQLNIPSSLAQTSAWGLVDYHQDNFGLLLGQSGNVYYQMNDPDNGAILPLYSEVLRYLVSTTFAKEQRGESLDRGLLKQVLQEYQNGLAGRPIEIPHWLEKRIKNFEQAKLKIDPKELDQAGKLLRKSSKGRQPQELRAEELQQLANALSSDYRIVDSYKFLNILGDSGGSWRFRVKVQASANAPLKHEQLLELKEVTPGRINPMSEKFLSPWDNFRGIFWLTEDAPHPSYNVIHLFDRDFLLRPKWQEMDLPAFAELKKEKADQLLLVQARILGGNHLKSLGSEQGAKFGQQVDQVKKTQWIDWSEMLVQDFRLQISELKRSFK